MTEIYFPGEDLRERRESMGRSIEEVSRMIHVPLQHLIALEEGDIDALPELTYTLGFLRTYCTFLELPVEPYTAQFRLAVNPPQTRNRFLSNLDVGGAPQSPWMSEIVTWGAICSLVALGWLTFNTLVKPFADRPEQQVEAGTSIITPPVHFDDQHQHQR